MRRTLLHIFGIRQDPAQPEHPLGGQGAGRRQGGQGILPLFTVQMFLRMPISS